MKKEIANQLRRLHQDKDNYAHLMSQEMLIREFVDWFHSRGEYYAKLPVKFYVDGEPYFSSEGAECNLRDYLRVKNKISYE